VSRVIYEERLLSGWITLLLGAVTLVLLWQVVQQFQSGSTGDAPLWLLPLLLLLFAALTVNFAWLTIRVTDDGVVVAYGMIRRRMSWDEIRDCYLDEASAVRYGGFGVRIGSYKGTRRLIFNTIGDPRVVVLTTSATTPEFVFSTAHPEEIIRIVREYRRSQKH
jgi:hypothetical protein